VSQIAVREAREEDLPQAMELLDELAHTQAGWRVFSPRDGFREQMLARYRRALDGPDARLYVAQDGPAGIVGMALAEIVVPSSFSDERAVELSSVVVRPTHRGRGVGKALVAAVGLFAAAWGVARVTLKTFAANDGAMRFWLDAGFEPRVIQLTARVQDLRAPGSRGDRPGR
jgi:GNAT superfamily N-acetyltransferase